jgi:MFS family permease
VSLVGDAVFLVAFTWQVAVQWGRPALLGLLLATRVLAELVVLGTGGWVIDRVPRRSLLIVTDAMRGLVLLVLATVLHQPASTGVLATLVAAFGILTGLFRPTLVAFLPEIVPREQLAAANSMLAVSAQISMVAGPAIGVALVEVGSAPTALRLDGVSFLVAAVASVPLPARSAAARGGGGLGQVVQGFRVARRVGWIGGSIAVFSLLNVGTIGAERLALPRLAADRYGRLGAYGAMLVAISVGAVVAAAVVGHARPAREPGRMSYGGAVLFCAALVSFGLMRGIVAAVLISLIFGFCQQVADLLWTIGLQHNVPDQLLGRVSAVDQFGSFLFLPLSFAGGGVVVQTIRPELVVLVAGGAGMALALIGVVVPSLHRWRRVGTGPWIAPTEHPGQMFDDS